MSDSGKGNKVILYLLFTALALLWGLSFLGTKVALEELEPIEVLAVRWGMSLVLFCFLGVTGIIKINFKGKNVRLLAIAVAIQPCIYSILEAWRINLTTSSESSIIIGVIPLMVVIEGFLFFIF